MKNSRILMKATMLAIASLFIANTLLAQCENWTKLPNKDQAETAHVLYRQEVKNEQYDAAYVNWKKAYELAPAADGKRPSHYSDGRKILMHKWEKETDEAKKKEYEDFILKLYDQQIECYGNDASLLGFKAYDMFYYFRRPYTETYEVLKEAIKIGEKKSPYTVLDPYATIAVYLFTHDKLSKEEARGIHDLLCEIADHNINSKNTYSAQYEQAKASVEGRFAEIKYQIFDCDYFKKELSPKYKADPNNHELVKDIYNQLRARGCDEADPIMVELKTKYEAYAAEENARRQAEFEANNPGFLAKRAYDEGDFRTAMNKYQEAVEKETDNEQKANYLFAMASIEFRKLRNLNRARQLAMDAASLRSGWGRPYMLIGDMYASSSRDCGDDWAARLAILAAVDKYAYARSIDGEVAGEANERIGKYRGSYPSKDEAFMRQLKEGDSVRVPCWIGETVEIRVQ